MSETPDPLRCAVCKTSCEGVAHARDSKGRIICRTCIDKKRAARSATDTGGVSVMAELLDKSAVSNATPCPGCKSYVPNGMVICTHCGFDLVRGKAMSTKIVESKPAKSGKGGIWPFARK